MKQWWYAFWMCWGMFCAIPCPVKIWEEKARPRMLACFPLLGGIIGAIWGLFSFLPAGAVRAFALTAAPWLLSGCMHLDGFMDTVDAHKSHAAPEKKRAILKDPHAGAFASIGLGAYLLAYFGLCAQLPLTNRTVLLLALIHVMSRSLSAVSGTLLPVRPGEGTLNFFHQATDKSVGLLAVGWVVLSAVLLILAWPLAGLVMTLAAVLALLLVRRMAMKEFEGMSGDIAGFQLQAAELVMLALLVLTERILAL